MSCRDLVLGILNAARAGSLSTATTFTFARRWGWLDRSSGSLMPADVLDIILHT